MGTLLAAEFQFIQAYLNVAPKLRAMVGANRSLAETLGELLQAEELQGPALPIPTEVAEIFEQVGALEEACFGERNEGDDPARQFGQGIMAAAGGHFESYFENEEKALEAARRFRAILASKAPGLAYSLITKDLALDESFADANDRIRMAIGEQKFAQSGDRALGAIPPGHPFAEGCCLIPGDMAVASKKYPGEPRRYYGARSSRFMEQGRHDAQPPVLDMAAWVEKAVLGQKKKAGRDYKIRLPYNFDEMAPGEAKRRHMAVITIDGNDMGVRLKAFQQKLAENNIDLVEGAAWTEAFFYRMRALNRIALAEALQSTASLEPHQNPLRNEREEPDDGGDDGETEVDTADLILPFRILMLGGDDALLILPPRAAVEFLQHYAKAYDRLLGAAGHDNDNVEAWKKTLGADQDPLTFKAGMAITPVGYPFHAAHHLAEELMASAKKSVGNRVSSVDWHVLFSSTPHSLAELRAREYCHTYKVSGRKETLHLTHRPYAIREGESLEKHWDAAAKLAAAMAKGGLREQRAAAAAMAEAEGERDDKNAIARSKLKALRSLVSKGRLEATLLLSELRKELQDEDLLKLLPKHAFEELSENEGETHWRTALMDLVELSDIETHWLRSKKAPAQAPAEV